MAPPRAPKRFRKSKHDAGRQNDLQEETTRAVMNDNDAPDPTPHLLKKHQDIMEYVLHLCKLAARDYLIFHTTSSYAGTHSTEHELQGWARPGMVEPVKAGSLDLREYIVAVTAIIWDRRPTSTIVGWAEAVRRMNNICHIGHHLLDHSAKEAVEVAQTQEYQWFEYMWKFFMGAREFLTWCEEGDFLKRKLDEAFSYTLVDTREIPLRELQRGWTGYPAFNLQKMDSKITSYQRSTTDKVTVRQLGSGNLMHVKADNMGAGVAKASLLQNAVECHSVFEVETSRISFLHIEKLI